MNQKLIEYCENDTAIAAQMYADIRKEEQHRRRMRRLIYCAIILAIGSVLLFALEVW